MPQNEVIIIIIIIIIIIGIFGQSENEQPI